MERSTDEDRRETEQIIRILRDVFNQYESPEDSQNREKILARLNMIVREWIKEASKGEDRGGKIFTFGSYRLGVHSPNTDIDALCVAPSHIDR